MTTTNTREETVTLQDSTITMLASNRDADGEWRTWMDIDKADYTDEVGEMWFSEETLCKLKNTSGGVDFAVLNAALHDTSGKVKDEEIVTAGSYHTTLDGNVITVAASNLKKHTNGQSQEGYWIGAKLVLPQRIADKADVLRFYFGAEERTSGTWSGSIASAVDADSKEKNEISFYANAGDDKPKVHIGIEMPSRLVKNFTMDLSGVTLDTADAAGRAKK